MEKCEIQGDQPVKFFNLKCHSTPFVRMLSKIDLAESVASKLLVKEFKRDAGDNGLHLSFSQFST